jgi:hypothetical protein
LLAQGRGRGLAVGKKRIAAVFDGQAAVFPSSGGSDNTIALARGEEPVDLALWGMALVGAVAGMKVEIDPAGAGGGFGVGGGRAGLR